MKEIKKKKGKRRWTRDDTDLTLISLPTFIWFVLFSYLPMFGIIIAFKDYKLSPGHGFIYNLLHSDWVGWSNFTYFFKSNAFWMLLRNTIVYNLVFIALGAAVAVGFALMLSNLRNKLASKAYQTMMFFPYFMSWVVISYIVYAVLTPEKGYLNNIIVALGGTKIMWYQEPKYWPFILTVVNLWKGIGMGSMMYFAALMGIDTSLYEAAEIDGASRFQKMLHISLPHLVPLICIFTIMNAGSLISGNFDLFYVIPRNTSTLYATTDILNTYVYRSLQESSYAIGATTGLIQSVVGMFLVLLSNWIVKKISPDNSMF